MAEKTKREEAAQLKTTKDRIAEVRAFIDERREHARKTRIVAWKPSNKDAARRALFQEAITADAVAAVLENVLRVLFGDQRKVQPPAPPRPRALRRLPGLGPRKRRPTQPAPSDEQAPSDDR